MGIRFWKRFRILPGVTVNVSRSGVSLSLGPRAAHVTVGGSGVRATVGVPGTGLSYTTQLGIPGSDDEPAAKKPRASRSRKAAPPSDTETSGLLAACEEISAGREDQALEALRTLVHLPDAAFLAGLLVLRKNADPTGAVSLLQTALKGRKTLGAQLRALDLEVDLDLPITDEVRVILRPDELGATLALVEALQRLGRREEAIALLEGLRKKDADNELIRLSLQDLVENG